jgi:CII-binding regulator of phage lambda lysogenization HflD
LISINAGRHRDPKLMLSREEFMASKDQRPSANPAMANLNPAQFAEVGKKQVEAVVGMQQELIDGIEEMSQEWAARIKAETDLATEFAGKLSAAKSLPDMAAIYQEWLSRRMQMFAEDSRRFAADTQKMMAKSAKLFTDGFKGGST